MGFWFHSKLHNSIILSPPQTCFHPQIKRPFTPPSFSIPFKNKPQNRESDEAFLSNTSSSNKRRRRSFNLSILAVIVSLHIPAKIRANAEQQQQQQEAELELERYTDSKQGFTLLIPHSWIQVDKAGATVLFEEPNKSANNVGVVVNPIRLATLQDFGTPNFVADKLILAEKRKESTKDAEVISVSERSGKGGLQVYEFEYKVDSTRGGLKRVFSAAFVASKKLYILNISHSDKPESPLDSNTRTILQHVVHSFDSA